jgi:hypothetical protein
MPTAKKPTPKKTQAAKAVLKKTATVNSMITKPKKVFPTKTGKKTSSPATKRLRKTPATNISASKKQTIMARKKAEDTVKVPSNAPLRSIEKAEVLRSELSLYWQKSMYRIAIVSGFCFLLIGSTLATVNVFEGTSNVKNDALVTTAVTEPLVSVLTLQSSVPDIIYEQTKVLFTLRNVYLKSVEYYLVNEATKKVSQRKRAEHQLGNKFSLFITPEIIPVGQYKLYIQYTQKSQLVKRVLAAKKTQVVAQLSIPKKGETIIEPVRTTNSVNTSDEPTVTSSDQIKPTTHEMLEDTTTSIDEPIITNVVQEQSAELTEEIATTVTTTTKINLETELENTEPIIEQEVQPAKPITQSFSLYTKETTVSDVLTVNIIQAMDFRNLELYARPVTSLNSRFLTRASERSEAKVFRINTAAFLPNGKYEFYARGVDASGKQQTTPSVLITVKNTSLAPLVTTTQDTQTPKKPAQEERVFAPINLDVQKDDSLVVNDIQEASERLFKQESIKITQLLRNYASARQSGDEILIKTAREALTDIRVELANDALVDKELAGISDDVILEMSQKLADSQNRVDTFEQIRSEKSGGQTALDTDKDGIPDFDEVNLYRTNPNEPDTDGDGFADGIEIVRGFDPLDDTAEAVIVFESPKESIGLVQADVLKVEEVIPVINSIAETKDTSVRTEIRGQGLPNSFVTLYIFSSPTIVTIKTDADGSFVYTLDKELEDGTHDVFVALTDNTGSIVAQSNPFSFIKEAQAFTPVDAANDAEVGGETAVQSVAKSSYNTVIGLGVLAFGLILLMLGLSLRTKEEEVVLASGRITDNEFGLANAKKPSNPKAQS